MRSIGLIPVFNEENTLGGVLEAITGVVDFLVVVDDGSTDRSLDLARSFASGRTRVAVLALDENRGMSSALREGFLYLAQRLRSGDFDPEDILFTLDADGQHDPREVRALSRYMEANGLDVALTRRDFSLYPGWKRAGNRLMSFWGSLWSGFPYRDIESGFRGMRLKTLAPLLDYYRGRRYSCAQEIAVLTALLGFRIDNGFVTRIQRYRSQTALRDVFLNAMFGFLACMRLRTGRKERGRPARARALIHPETLDEPT